MFKDVLVGTALGANRAAQNALQFGYDTFDWFDDALGIDAIQGDYKVNLNPHNVQTQTAIGGIAAAASQFLTGFSALGKLSGVVGLTAKAAKAGKLAQYGLTAAQGVVTDTVFQDPFEERLSNLVESVPSLSNPITQYLAANPNDSKAEARFKNALEGAGVGLLFDGLFSTVKGIRAYRAAKASGATTKELNKIGNTIIAEAKQATDIINPEKTITGTATDPLTENITKGIDNLVTNLRAKDIPVDEILSDIDHVLKGETANLKTEGLKDVVDSITAEIDPTQAKEMLVEISERIKTGAPVGEYIPKKSLLNTENMPEPIRQATKVLEETFGIDTRGVQQMTHIPNEQRWKDAIDYAVKLTGDQNIGTNMQELVKQSGEIGEALPYITVNLQRNHMQMGERLTEVIKAMDAMEPEQLSSFLATNGTQTLIDFKIATLKMDKWFSGIGESLQLARYPKPGVKTALKHTQKTQKIQKGTDLADIINIKDMGLADAEQAIKAEVTAMTQADIFTALRRASFASDNVQRAHLFRPDTKLGKMVAMSNELWLNAILSGPVTHLTNIATSLIKLGVTMPIEKMMAAGYGRLSKGAWTPEDKQMWVEGTKAWAGIYHTFSDAWQMAKKSYELGHNILKPANSILESQVRALSSAGAGIDAKTTLGSTINTIGKVANVPTRALMAEDELFSQLAYRSSIYTKLYTKAETMIEHGTLQLKGTKAETIAQYITDNFQNYFRDTMTVTNDLVRKGTGMDELAMEAAEAVTFTQSLRTGSVGAGIQKMAAEHPWFKRFVAPFVRTPINILNDAIAHTPILANMTSEYRAAIQAGGRDAALAQSKLALGGAIWATTAMLAAEGTITGGGSKNPTERATLMETGWQPYSIKLDNGDGTSRYISYARLEPFATILVMAGDFVDIVAHASDEADEGNTEITSTLANIATGMLFSIGTNLSSKTYTQGVSELLAALTGSDTNQQEAFIKKQALSYIPAAFSQGRKIVDPAIRETQGIMDEAMSRIPGLSQTLPPRYSWLTGKPLITQGGRLSGFLPVTWTDTEENPIAQELSRFSRSMLGLSKEIGQIPLTPQQQSEYARLHGTVTIDGKTVMEALETLFQSQEYDMERKTLPDTKDSVENPRRRMIDKVVGQYRNLARKELLKDNPTLRDQLLARSVKGELHKIAGDALFESQLQAGDTTKVSEAKKLYDQLMKY